MEISGIKKLILALLMAGLVVAETSCSSEKIETGILVKKEQKPKEEIELSLFYSGENTSWIAAVEELCERFMNENNDIIISMEHSGSGSYTEELKTKEAADDFPDIFEIDNPYMFENAGKLGVIDEKIGKLVENPVVIEGNIYALPFYSTSYGIVYNQMLFKKYGLSIPKTYEEFMEICRILKRKGIAPLAVGGNDKSAATGWMNYFFLTEVEKQNQNWQEKRNQGKVSFQDEIMEKVLEDFQNLMTGEFVLEDSINMGDNQIISHMINREAAMYYGTPDMLAKIEEAYPEAVDSDKTPLGKELENDTRQIQLGWFYMPDVEGNRVVIDKVASSWSVSRECMEDADKKAAVERFLEFCYKRENYRKILQSICGIPVTKDAVLYAAPMVQQGVLKDYRYARKSENFLGNIVTPESFRRDMEIILDSVAMNTMSVKTASQLLDKSWDKAVEVEE